MTYPLAPIAVTEAPEAPQAPPPPPSGPTRTPPSTKTKVPDFITGKYPSTTPATTPTTYNKDAHLSRYTPSTTWPTYAWKTPGPACDITANGRGGYDSNC
jgi:hypothetical protein